MSNTVRYGTPNTEYAMSMAMMPPEDDGPVWMVNLMKYREVADYADGRESAISGRDADDAYSPLDSLAAVGAAPVFFGDVDQQLLGDETTWDRVGVVKYPTRKAFIDMQSLPSFQKSHHHKDAGMESTIVIGSQPMEMPTPPEGFEQADWADVPHPPTADDGPVVVVHVLRFHDTAQGTAAAERTPNQMEQYQTAAAKVALGHGVRISGWFAVEDTIIGDGRAWHQVRFNEFPSKAAFMAVVMDPVRLEAQKDHREAAIADTYTMIVRARLNELEASIDS
ncbi:hypothetical protein [uncultured Ilumatobacter sp.]|uniref:hypothetical protein n=1 Tax=uncultured Ilumatobacter sp. TaxID=879968 RepID=UPI00374FDB13|tara:strand:+ start:720 stop:1559 length:840 start_codon:yes stop_codon:yes gene_type:complete